MNFEIHYMNNIHTYAYYICIYNTYIFYIMYIYIYNTYIKIRPYVIIKFFQDAINLVIIATNGTYQPING